MVFDPTKPAQTRAGRPVRILCTDRRSSVGLSIVALISHSDVDVLAAYRSDGRSVDDPSRPRPDDLINVPEVLTHHFNIIRAEFDGITRYDGPYKSSEEADNGWSSIQKLQGKNGATRIAVIHLRFREGDGLDFPEHGRACTPSVKE